MSISRRRAHRGQRCTLYFLYSGERCRARDFLGSLQAGDQQKSDGLFYRIAHEGPPHNEQKYRRLQAPAPLWEVKPTSQVRFIGFWDGPADFLITHGFFKRRTSDTRREIEAALRLRDEYYADKD